MNVRYAAAVDIPTVVGHFIDGEERHDDSRLKPVTNPATGEIVRRVGMATQDTVRDAIAAAETAFPAWRNTPPAKRARIMFRFKQLLETNADAIVRLITEEHGKILQDARGELQRGVEVVEYACGVRSASSRVSRPSTFQRWFPCGCIRWPLPAAIPSC